MEKIYWLTRLDAISTTAIVSAVLFGIGTAISWILHWTTAWDDPKGVYEPEITFSNKTRWPFLITFILSILIAIFTPTKKDMFMILGIGGTIEYIQKNETLQGLPDKCVQALDAWVDTWTEYKDSD